MAIHNINLVEGAKDTNSENPAPEDKNAPTRITVFITQTKTYVRG